MRIHNLEISNIRGIRHFQRDFQGKNAVILGTNGTGKSSILDAIDFLLSGDISRLHGEGTGGITLKRHGGHVDLIEQLDQCYVKATVELQNHPGRISIERSIIDPDRLTCSENARPVLEQIRRHATQGQHMLQRRQMLNFVHVAPSDRAARIEALLNLDAVSKTRKNLQSVSSELRKWKTASQNVLERSQSKVTTLLKVDSCEHELVLHATNQYRKDLGLPQISTLSVDALKEGIGRAVPSTITQPSPSLVLEYVTKIEELIDSANLDAFAQQETCLRQKLSAVHSDPRLSRSLEQIDLIRRGIDLIETDACPLCDEPWIQRNLEDHLKSKIETAQIAHNLFEEIESTAKSMNANVRELLTRIPSDKASLDCFTVEQSKILGEWHGQLEELSVTLQDSFNLYPVADMSVSQVANLFVDGPLRKTIFDIRDILVERAKADMTKDSRQETAREILTLLANNWEVLLENEETLRRAQISFERAAKLQSAFTDARDNVLASIYVELSGEFTRLYRKLHSSDENHFQSKLCQQGAALHLNVDFYGRGKHPPMAFHSEGHQDSMGLCLYLVLSERLSGDDLQLMILDDVVTSIDVEHRRELASLLADELPHRQVILTTHDSDWNQMLLLERFAEPPNIIRIDRWDIDVGMVHSDISPLWESIEDLLNNYQLVPAAAEIRNWAERFFKQVCHSFMAPVTYKVDCRYTLDDVLSPGLKRFEELLLKATKKARNSGNSDLVTELQAMENRRTHVYEAIAKEIWLINRTVHDNEGINPTSKEIRGAVQALRDFYELIHCRKCSRLMSVSSRRETLFCKCGQVNWKL